MTFFVRPEDPVPIPHVVKAIAYGNPGMAKQSHPDIRMGRLYRLERGFPYLRQLSLNKPVSATPQFRALTLYTINVQTAQIPSSSTTAGQIIYPALAQL